MHFAQTLLTLCTAASAVLGAPTPSASSPQEGSKLQTRQTTFNGKSLSILPLGDSITVRIDRKIIIPGKKRTLTIKNKQYGVGSPSSNSYRAPLLTSLTTAGAKVDYIGSVRSGTLSDKDNEGHPGWTIDQIAGAVSNVQGTPTAVLLHAGTNDCNTYGWETAHERLGKLVDVVTAKWPRAAVLVAKIVPSQSANTNNNIKSFNSKVQGTFWKTLNVKD